jgi:hypothetical protein
VQKSSQKKYRNNIAHHFLLGYGESPPDLDDWKKASESILSPGKGGSQALGIPRHQPLDGGWIKVNYASY